MPPRAALEQVQHRASPDPIVRCLLEDEVDACDGRIPLVARRDCEIAAQDSNDPDPANPHPQTTPDRSSAQPLATRAAPTRGTM